MTLRSVTHRAQWVRRYGLLTECGQRLIVPPCKKNTGTFWCRNEETRIRVDFDTPIDCMTCLVLEARGG